MCAKGLTFVNIVVCVFVCNAVAFFNSAVQTQKPKNPRSVITSPLFLDNVSKCVS